MIVMKTINDREGQRLDNYLFQIYKATPNSHVYRMIRKGRIKINGKSCKDNTYKLQRLDEIQMPNPINPKKPIPSQKTINVVKSMIVHECEDFWLLNKKPNFCVHHSQRDTFGIIEVMQHLYSEAHLIHRLDRNTTGCLLIAKSYDVLKTIQELWKDKKVKKYYQLLSFGKWKYSNRISVNKPLLRLNDDSNQVMVSQRGKEAVTHFYLLQQYKGYCLLEALIETGRTHQIRVHASSISYPIVGDRRYNHLENTLTEHIFLHAAKLDFIWRGEHKVLECNMSTEQLKCLQDLD